MIVDEGFGCLFLFVLVDCCVVGMKRCYNFVVVGCFWFFVFLFWFFMYVFSFFFFLDCCCIFFVMLFVDGFYVEE